MDRGAIERGIWMLALVLAAGPLVLAQTRTGPSRARAARKQPQASTAPKAAPAPAVANDAADAEADAIVKAEHALDKQDAETAIALLKGRETRNERVYFDLGYAYSIAGQREEAIAAYRRALALKPDLPQANQNLAVLLLAGKQPREALPFIEKVLASRGNDARVHSLLASALGDSGEHARAVEEYRKALALDPAMISAYMGLAHEFENAKEYGEAENALRKAAELQPGDSGTRLEIAGLMEATGRPDEAIRVYTGVIAADPNNAVAHRRLALLLLARRQYAEAATHLEAAARIAPEPEDEWNLARAYAAEKRPEAIALLQKRVAAQPRDYEARLLLGEALLEKKQLQPAVEQLQQAIALRPNMPDAYVDLANALYAGQNYQGVIAVLDRLAKLGKETPWSDFLRGISLDKLGYLDETIASYERFLSAAGGKYPDQEFQARQRIKALRLAKERGGRRRVK